MKYKGFTYTPAPKTAWDNLSMQEKSEMMKVAVRNGITDLKTVREKYNEFAGGGYLDWKEKASKYKPLDIDNDRTYDYEGWYNENPQRAWDFLNDSPDTHFDDKYKTVYHPTFSTQSRYSGIVNSAYNPQGLIGGTWNKQGSVFTMSPDGYRGPVSMDERKWYLENAEDNGVQLREADGNLPVFDGIPWGGVLPNVTVTGNKFGEGGIHIKPENKGKFTALKERTGHSATWFKEHGTPAQKKMAVFALNSRHWKHGLGGNLFENGGNENSMNYEHRGTIFDDDLKNQGITHVAELPEVVVKGRDYTKPYKSAFEYDPNFAKELPYFLPVVGDALDVADVAKDIYNGDYLNAGIGAGLFALPNFIEKPIKKIGRKAYQLLTAPTRKAAEKGRSTLLEAIPSSWNRERWNIAAPYENTDAIINDLEQRARTVPFNYSKTSDKLNANGETVTRPALVYYKDGKKVKDYYNSGLDVYIASDLGKRAHTTGIHELIHYLTGNSHGLPKVGIPKFGSLFEPVEIDFNDINETTIPPSTLYQHGMVDYNDSLLPKINRNSKAVIEEDDYALDKQENQTWLKTWFLSDIKPHLKNPNDANEIESFLNEHPELIKNNDYVNTLMKDTRPGTNKDYAKALSRMLYSTLVTAGLLNTVKDE